MVVKFAMMSDVPASTQVLANLRVRAVRDKAKVRHARARPVTLGVEATIA